MKDPEGAAKTVVAADATGSANLKVQMRQMKNQWPPTTGRHAPGGLPGASRVRAHCAGAAVGRLATPVMQRETRAAAMTHAVRGSREQGDPGHPAGWSGMLAGPAVRQANEARIPGRGRENLRPRRLWRRHRLAAIATAAKLPRG